MPQCMHRNHYKDDGLVMGWDPTHRQWQYCDQGFLRIGGKHGKKFSLTTSEINSEYLRQINVAPEAGQQAPRPDRTDASPETRRFQQRVVRRKEVREGIPETRKPKPPKKRMGS